MQKYEENYYRACALILKHGAKSKRSLLNHHLQNSNQTLYQFIEKHGHDLLHLHVGKKRCCRCKIILNYVVPSVKPLLHAQMEVLFSKNGHLQEHCQRVLPNEYCCRYPNPRLTPEDLDITILNILFSNFCNDLFWESCMNGQTLDTFLNNKKHSLYHLWRYKEPCHFNKCTSAMKSKTRRIEGGQWKKLFHLTNDPLICKDGEACSCLHLAIPGIQVIDIEKDLAREILHSTCPLKQAAEGIVVLRNTYFAHVKSNSLSDMDFRDALKKCEDYMKTIAIACNSSVATIKDTIEHVKVMALDGSICDQLNKLLLSQIVERTDINKNLKNNNRKLNIIDEKNNQILAVGLEIKEDHRQILKNQEKLFQQNEQILARLNRENWYEKIFNKVTCFFASSVSVLESWFVSSDGSQSAEHDSGDEREMYKFTCNKCKIAFTILEEFLKHKEKKHDKKPRQRVKTTITGADKVWESVVMKSSRSNLRRFDVESFEIENARSGSLIFVAKLSSAVVASKDKILVLMQAFLINLFKRCPLPSMDLKSIDIKVEVYESFSDEEDGEECDTYYCGRCEKEYKSLGSFLLHTESQEHKLNKKNLKDTKTYTQPTNALSTKGLQNEPTHIDSPKPKDPSPASVPQPFPVPDEPSIIEEYTVPNLPANLITSKKERLVEKMSEIAAITDCSDVEETKVHNPNRNITDVNDAYQSDSKYISSGYETGNSTEPNKEDIKQVRKKGHIGIQEDSGLSEFSDIEETKLLRENQSSINKQKMKSCTDNSVPLSSEIDSCETADVNMIAEMNNYIAVSDKKRSTVSPCSGIPEIDDVQQKLFHGKTRKSKSARQRRKKQNKKLSTTAEVHYADEITIDLYWANEEDYYLEYDQSHNISDDDFSLYSEDDNDLTHSTKGGLSEDAGRANIEIKKNKGNFYEKSKQLHAQERRKSGLDTQMLQYGLELSGKCLYDLQHKYRRHARKYVNFYTPLNQDEASLQIKYEQNPTIYRKAKIQIISSHTAVCTLNEPYNGIETVEISGRSKCGKAYTDDEVFIEIFQEKGHTHHIKRMNKNINTSENLFGQVIGLFNRNRYDRIDHPVLVCELDKYEYDKAKPVCKTLPKFHLLTENTEDRPNPFSVDIYDYNEKTKRITHNRSLQVSPALRQKYLFYIAYISWESLYPLGAIIKVHKSTDDLISALHILELQYKVPTLYARGTIKEADRILGLRSLHNRQNRYDLTKLCNPFTIDPMNSDVLDDAVSIDKLRNGGYRVGVHITDVSSFVDIDSALDEEACQRGTTFFRGQFGDPHQMLPEPISIKCSLKEGKSRLAFSIFFHFDETFKYINADTKCCKSVIASRSQITYTQVQNIITNQAEHKFKTGILTLFEISKSLRKRRLGNGMASINYEQDVFEDEENSTNFPEAFYLIEEIMILTNHSVATYLLQKFPDCVPLRCQDPPLSTKLKEWRKAYPKISDLILRLQGYPKTLDMKTKIDIDVFDKPDGPKLRCNDIMCVQKWLWSSMADCLNNRETTKAAEWLRKEDLHPFHALAIQKWKSIQMFAEYRCSGMFTGSKIKHFSLGIFPYTHFTSPVRRYIDIVVHRLLHAAIDGSSPPYSCEEVHSICQDMNRIAKEAKDYGNHCKSLLLADKLKTSPLTVHAFVDECNEKELSLLIPGCSYLNKHCTLLKLNLLGVYERPKFKADRDKPNSEAGRQYVILTWKDRIYSTSGRRPFPKYPKDGYHVMPKGQPQKINPHQKTEFKQMSVWIECIKGLVINYDPSNMLPRINVDPYDTIAASFLLSSVNTENDVNSEVKHIRDPKSKRQNTETAFITEQYCSYSMNFHHGQVIAVQLSSEIQKGILTPYIQLVDMTQNLKYCLQHMQDPVGTLEEYSTTSTKLRYDDSNHYISVWIPIILMETAMSVVRDDAIVINNIMVSINENNGYLILRSDFCFERNIDFGGKPVYFKEEEDDDDDTEENENQVFQSEDYLCIRCPVSTQTNEYMRVRKTTAPKEYNIWTNHAKTTKVNKTRKNTPEEKLRIHFRFLNDRPLPSTQRIMCSVEIMQKPEIDKRVEVLVGHINRSTLLAKAIALNRKVPTLDENRLEAIKAKDVDIGLPANNKQQEKAILISLRSTFSLIHGPPGTGKTNMGIKLVCLFKEINERVKSEEEDKKQIVYCGPSNKSVDLVAARLLQLSRHSENTPKIARLYGSSIEILDYPLPGRVSSTSKNTRDSKSDERLKAVTIHHLIRSHGNPHAEEIKALFLDIVQTQAHIAAGITIWPFVNPINALKEENNELPDDRDETNEGEAEEEDKEHKSIMDKIKQYNKLVQEATIEELKKYDVIFCTTAMATNSRLLKGMEGRIYQVIIDECGMCTEPECISTIIATKAKQVVLIGDHKQLRPVVVCPQARQLGLQRSLFERYQNDKNVVQLTVQYRMHPSICEFPSRKFYNDKLITDEKSKSYVETRPLKVWFSEEKRTVFCHVEGEEEILPVSTEEGNEMSRRNQAEVDLVIKIYRHLHNNERIFESKGLDKKLTINIMSQYKDQCAAMRSALEKVGFKNVNVNTVVSSQGGEWDYVIFSLVRSLPDYRIEKSPTRGWCSQNLGFITDEHQINVALTRAKKGLFLIGNKHLLKCDEVWKDLIQTYDRKGCVVNGVAYPPPYHQIVKRKKYIKPKHTEIDDDGFQKV